MKRRLWIFLSVLLLTGVTACGIYFKLSKPLPYDLQDGDIVFMEGRGGQADAVKAATNSRWSHVGIIFYENGKPMVLEAVQPVRIVPLDGFIKRSRGSFYAMRLKDYDSKVSPAQMSQAKKYGKTLVGKNYDLLFQWSDDRIYCSELVWKIYQRSVKIELSKPRKMRSYQLDHPTVERIIKQRYGSKDRLPLDELVVAPSDLAESPLLIECPRKKNQ